MQENPELNKVPLLKNIIAITHVSLQGLTPIFLMLTPDLLTNSSFSNLC